MRVAKTCCHKSLLGTWQDSTEGGDATNTMAATFTGLTSMVLGPEVELKTANMSTTPLETGGPD